MGIPVESGRVENALTSTERLGASKVVFDGGPSNTRPIVLKNSAYGASAGRAGSKITEICQRGHHISRFSAQGDQMLRARGRTLLTPDFFNTIDQFTPVRSGCVNGCSRRNQPFPSVPRYNRHMLHLLVEDHTPIVTVGGDPSGDRRATPDAH